MKKRPGMLQVHVPSPNGRPMAGVSLVTPASGGGGGGGGGAALPPLSAADVGPKLAGAAGGAPADVLGGVDRRMKLAGDILDALDEGMICHTLRSRFAQDAFYTSVGHTNPNPNPDH